MDITTADIIIEHLRKLEAEWRHGKYSRCAEALHDALKQVKVPTKDSPRGTVYDWATQAAMYIDVNRREPIERITAIIETFAQPLVEMLQLSRRQHNHCDCDDNGNKCCPRCACLSWRGEDSEPDDEHTPNSDEPCTCGADDFNKRLELALVGKLISR